MKYQPGDIILTLSCQALILEVSDSNLIMSWCWLDNHKIYRNQVNFNQLAQNRLILKSGTKEVYHCDEESFEDEDYLSLTGKPWKRKWLK